MDEITKKLKKYGQEHLFEYFDELSERERAILIEDIANTDFSILENLNDKSEKSRGALSPADALPLAQVKKEEKQLEEIGLKTIRAGKVAAVLLAGGQGTRLGSDLPKGMFDIGVTRELTIFEQQMDNIRRVTEKAGIEFRIFVMTSFKNDAVTREFFEKKNYFGYDKNKILFYVQSVAPACSEDGKVFLDEKYKLSLSPNGNGGWYSSLVAAGYDKLLAAEGVEWLNIYSVDNVLQRICDPVFIGATVKSGCACSAKVVKKVSPEEKVGVICKEDGLPTIVEYYELPADLANRRDEDGELTFGYGVTLNYLFGVEKLNRIYKQKLPYHLAHKAIPHIEKGIKVTPAAPNGYKFETLAVDMVKMMGSCLAVEVEREKEFAPVKNKTGVDSVETARALLLRNGVNL